MSDDLMDEFGETQRRVLDLLASVHDQCVDDVIHLGYYKGPDAALHAKNQVDREMIDALTMLVRKSRSR